MNLLGVNKEKTSTPRHARKDLVELHLRVFRELESRRMSCKPFDWFPDNYLKTISEVSIVNKNQTKCYNGNKNIK